MYLIIDNTIENKIFLFCGDETKVVTKEFNVIGRGGLVSCLDIFLKENKIILKKLRGIGVIMGIGRFTSTRLATTVANTLAYALHIPVASLKAPWQTAEAFKKIKKSKTGQFVAAVYSGQARIGCH